MNKKTIFFVVLLCVSLITALNMVLLKGAPIYDRYHRPSSSVKCDGYFRGRYVVNDPNADDKYVKNPLISTYNRTGSAVMDLEITPDRFTAITRPTSDHGYETVISSVIGKEIFYSGNGVFTFYTSSFGFGGIFPGTGYEVREGKIRVCKESVSIEVTQIKAFMVLFVIPGVERMTFKMSFPEKLERGPVRSSNN